MNNKIVIKFCSLCGKERKFTQNSSVCDGCRYIIDYNNKNRKFKKHHIHFHDCLGLQLAKAIGGWAMSYHDKDGTIFINMKSIMSYCGIGFIPYLVNILSHEYLHTILRKEHGKFTSFMMDRSKFLKVIKEYLGGLPSNTPDETNADKWYETEMEKFIAERRKQQ